MERPKIGIFGLTGCAGEQIVILNCEDELLDLVSAVDIRDFLTATSANDTGCDLDISFVEGTVLNTRDEETAKEIRKRSSLLIAAGTCAAWGGIPAMEADVPREEIIRSVYGDEGDRYDIGPPRKLSDVVKVDAVISGCPIEKEQFVSAVADLLNGNLPLLTDTPVCIECKMKENVCLLEKREVCCGPLTVGGCNARCPSLGIPCVGCHGPVREPNYASQLEMLKEKDLSEADITRKLRSFAVL